MSAEVLESARSDELKEIEMLVGSNEMEAVEGA